MILYKGDIFSNEQQLEKISHLKNDCYQTLHEQNILKPMDVILACDQLAQKVKSHAYDDVIIPLLEAFDIPYDYFLASLPMFEKQALIKKCQVELGKDFDQIEDLDENHRRSLYPLGILFHIAAGNVDILPAYSVIEGLLVGNINILKLPSGDQGLSVKLLSELIKIEPKLKPYIYVFDVPSTEVETLQQFAGIADAIVVWGGDVAVKAARQMASVTTKIIEWGHKLSFAYATLDASKQDLIDLAHHIMMTNQVLCSSCQGIYVDTNDRNKLDDFAKRFFDILISVSKDHKPVSLGMRAKNTLQIYTEKMEQHQTKKTIYDEHGMSVIASDDQTLEISMLFRNVWVKRLQRDEIIKVIKPHKNHLQTAALLCQENDIDVLSDLLAKAGIVRIKRPKDMSLMTVGEAHDGMYALRLYSRVVESISPNKS